jgi:hypothetical protein
MPRDLIEEAREAVARAKLIVESARAALDRAQETRRDIEAARRRRGPQAAYNSESRSSKPVESDPRCPE